MDKDEKRKIYNISSLAFQCTIAKVRPAINHGKFKRTWSSEANDVFKEHSLYPKKLFGKVSFKIILFFEQIINYMKTNVFVQFSLKCMF